jgi:hypothetical protein
MLKESTVKSTESNKDASRTERNADLSERIHDRARQSGVELHKLTIGLATGILATYFVGMTARADPPLTSLQRICTSIGLVVLATALGAGLFAWYADTKRNYYWARALVAAETKKRNELYARRDSWIRRKDGFTRAMYLMFSLGIVSSGVYVLLRVFAV